MRHSIIQYAGQYGILECASHIISSHTQCWEKSDVYWMTDTRVYLVYTIDSNSNLAFQSFGGWVMLLVLIQTPSQTYLWQLNTQTHQNVQDRDNTLKRHAFTTSPLKHTAITGAVSCRSQPKQSFQKATRRLKQTLLSLHFINSLNSGVFS